MRNSARILMVIFAFGLRPLMAQLAENPYDKGNGKVDKMLFDIYHENWIKSTDTVKVDWKSHGWGVSLMYDVPLGKSSNFSVAIGGGYAINHVYSKAQISTISNPDSTKGGTYALFVPIADNRNVKNNKLVTNYIDIPLELRFRSKEDQLGNRVRVTLGAKVGRMVNIHAKYNENGYKYKYYVFPDANVWRYGAFMRIGYERWTLFGYYGFSTLFNPGKGDVVNPFSAGITYTIL